MTAPLVLFNKTLRCELRPELGGCITGLWLGDEPVLRSAPAASVTTSRLSGSYALVPFSNRIGHATLQWQGTSHPLIQNNAPEPHAIHGHGWQRPWEVLESDSQYAMLAFEHQPDPSWPFAFDTSQTLRLNGHTLELTLNATNQSPEPAPIGLGWHPFFVKRPGSHLRFAAAGRWENGADMLPVSRSASSGLDTDCANLVVDNCFDGWTGEAELSDPVLRTRITSNLRHLVVFTHQQKDFVAIEPVSHVNNALNQASANLHPHDALGVTVLQPGETLSVQMNITAERTS